MFFLLQFKKTHQNLFSGPLPLRLPHESHHWICSHKDSRVYPTLIFPHSSIFSQTSSSFLLQAPSSCTPSDSPEGFIQAFWTASFNLSAQGTLTLPTLPRSVSPMQSTAFAQHCSRAAAAPNEPLWLGTRKQQDHSSHPLCQQTHTDAWPVILESSQNTLLQNNCDKYGF